MPLLEKIVEQINTTIKSSFTTKELQLNQLFGIADKCFADDPGEGAPEIRPVVVDNHGDGKAIEYDNGHNLVIYHRILTNTYADSPSKNYGGIMGKICTTEMIMVVSADKRKIQRSAIELEALIESVFPQQLSKDLLKEIKLSQCRLSLLGSVFDQMQVFAGEYTNVPFFIKPQQAYFSIRYRLQSEFRPGCFNSCCND